MLRFNMADQLNRIGLILFAVFLNINLKLDFCLVINQDKDTTLLHGC